MPSIVSSRDQMRVTVDDEVRPLFYGLSEFRLEMAVGRDDSPASDGEPHGRMVDHEIETVCVRRECPFLVDVAEDQANRGVRPVGP